MVKLREYAEAGSGLTLDKAKGVVRNIRVLGNRGRSANGRRYTEQCLREAVPLYEGAPVYLNHSGEGGTGDVRDIRDKIGRLVNPRFEKGGITADLEYVKTHPFARTLEEMAEAERDWVGGLSHNVDADVVRGGGPDEEVRGIKKVWSCDLVSEPATTRGLREHRRKPVSTTLRRLVERLKGKRPNYARGLREAEAAGIMGPDTQMVTPDDDGEDYGEPDSESGHEQAIRDAAKAVIDDGELSVAVKLEKIEALLKLAAGDDDDDEDEADGARESIRRKLSGAERRGLAIAEGRVGRGAPRESRVPQFGDGEKGQAARLRFLRHG